MFFCSLINVPKTLLLTAFIAVKDLFESFSYDRFIVTPTQCLDITRKTYTLLPTSILVYMSTSSS